MDILVKVRNLEDLEHDWNRGKSYSFSHGIDKNIFRRSMKNIEKGCYCGNHSCGKEIFFYEKNRRLYGVRLLRRHHERNKKLL